jgi:hypothetical protein
MERALSSQIALTPCPNPFDEVPFGYSQSNSRPHFRILNFCSGADQAGQFRGDQQM